MRLDDLRVALSPRRSWEAMDLGLAILARWRAAVYLPWLAVTIPLVAILCFALRDQPSWIPVVLWFCKPLLDRVPLHVLSSAVFGPAPRPAEVLARLPKLLVRRIPLALFAQRFTTQRGLVMPVDQLEQPKGPARKARLRVLGHGRTGGSASTALVLYVHFEFCLMISCIALATFLGPEDWSLSAGEFFEYGESNLTLDWIMTLAYAAAILLLEPAFVATGFGIYLCRRTDLEGWDLELGFRTLARRIASDGEPKRKSRGTSVALLLAALGGLGVLSTEAQAQDPAVEVQEILSSEAFDTTITKEQWVPPDFNFGPMEGFMDAVGPLLVGLAWVGAAILILLLVGQIVERARGSAKSGTKRRDKERPVEAFGLDLRQESLPADPAAQALVLWNQGRLRDALSLLYRGALVHLVDSEELDIRSSDTEHDCVVRVHSLHDSDKASFFEQLTSAWLHSAWGARPPAQDAGNALCATWSQHFGGRA